jgi:hypothetical protein
MYTFMSPRARRKDALIELPIIPPMRENVEKCFDTADAVAATTSEVTITMLEMVRQIEEFPEGLEYVEWPSEKNVPTVTGF